MDTHEPREGVTNPKRTCAKREGETQNAQTQNESYRRVAQVEVDFDTLNTRGPDGAFRRNAGVLVQDEKRPP